MTKPSKNKNHGAPHSTSLLTTKQLQHTELLEMSTISRILPIAANDVSGQLKNTDDFDLALMALMVHAVKDELACLRNLHDDFLAVIKREEKNRRYYLKTKESRKRKRNENSNAELNPD
eukprot:scaffold27456_cov66-Skeletonema_marinoi.AAC.1